MTKTLRDVLIQKQQNGHPITIRFIGIGLQVFRFDSELERALWDMELRIERKYNEYSLIDIYDPFSSNKLKAYELDDGIYIDLDKELD